ncbi:sulfur oxidation c-type cytochrome SoxX [Thiohalophilus thiocyanatoxydans]|uniref:Monoheme cytochrome SoxX (Sulfur oxidation) n=1 Tax=Thiohalophilus thiocyanatoxydans TaxID=381308 RepID=A0A4R8ILJ7_9GAMM|nr:sulfur oxidation c-type cytochrome SoxX [Thiohalophilus thiocyanatoxydans]TDY01681.1 monoheme cytochrome SoxX (sulfur oxidation) [Thiohalophilus thiocyanatoxydans]
MRKAAKLIAAASTVAMLLGSMAMVPSTAVAADADTGKKLAENRKKGNCFACHSYEGAHLPGNIGPPLVAMKSRFPDKDRVREQIANPTKFNPNSMMPPFGKHNILTEEEIDHITEWVYTL